MTDTEWSGRETYLTIFLIADVLPEDFDFSGHCNSKHYFAFETRAVQYLKDNGWKFPLPSTIHRDNDFWYGAGDKFVTTDGDAFGPLVRILFEAIRPDGTVVDLSHG